MRKQINYCLNLEKQIGNLKMQNSFAKKTDGTKYDFNRCSRPFKFIAKIHNYEITLNKAIKHQTELKILISKLINYNPTKLEKIK